MRPEIEEKVNGETSAMSGRKKIRGLNNLRFFDPLDRDIKNILQHIHMSKDEFIPIEGIFSSDFREKTFSAGSHC